MDFADHINQLQDELQFLRKHHHFQAAKSQALADIVVEKLSSLTGESVEKIDKELRRREKKSYETILEAMRQISAEAAAHLDIRNDLDFQDQMKWFDDEE